MTSNDWLYLYENPALTDGLPLKCVQPLVYPYLVSSLPSLVPMLASLKQATLAAESGQSLKQSQTQVSYEVSVTLESKDST